MTTQTPQAQQKTGQQAQAAAPADPVKRTPMSPTDAASRISALLQPTNKAGAEAGQQPQTKRAPDAPQKKKAAPAAAAGALKKGQSDPLGADAGGDDAFEETTETTDENLTDEEAAAAAAEQAGEEGAEGSDGEDAGEGEDQPSETDENSDDLHTIVIDGKESSVTYEELISGYQRQADYTRKMQSLAKERKDVEAVKEQVRDLPKVQKAYQDGAERFSKNAQLVMVALEQRFMPKQPDPALAETNPGLYIKQKEQFQEALQFRAGLAQELQGLELQTREAHKKQVFEGRQKLFEIVPEMKDTTTRQKLTEYARSHGFTDDQIANEASPVLFQWAHKARMYDEIMARKAQLTPDKSKPKVAKQAKASEGHQAVQVRQRQNAIESHKREKSVDSAARALAGIGLK